MPSIQEDIVVIGIAPGGTHGTPRNFYRAHDHQVEMTYDGADNLVQVDEVMEGTLRKRTMLSYIGDDLDTVTVQVFALDGVSVRYQWTDTMVYDMHGNLIRVERGVA